MKLNYLILVTGLLAFTVNADNSTLDAAIGGGVGGAAGAAIGNEIGGRDGAIIGGALGAAVGTAVNTDEAPRHTHPPAEIHYRATPPHYDHPHHYHCPPGQRKKGRC